MIRQGTIGQSEFDKLKKTAIQYEPFQKTIALEQLSFLTLETVDVMGAKFGISKNAIKSLSNLVGIPLTTSERLKGNLGEDFTVRLLNSLKEMLSKMKSTEVDLIVDRNRIIQSIAKSSNLSKKITNASFFDIIEPVIEQNNFTCTHFAVQEDGSVDIALMSPNKINVGGIDEEVFKPGFKFSNNIRGFYTDSYVNRLFCTNGMVTPDSKTTYKLDAIGGHELNGYYEHLKKLQNSNFVSPDFFDKVKMTMDSKASVSEVESAINTMLNNSRAKESVDVQRFLDLRGTYLDYMAADNPIDKISHEARKSAPTQYSVWDVINAMTDFGSHDHGFEVKNPMYIQTAAGRILSKTPDLKNIISKIPPGYNR